MIANFYTMHPYLYKFTYPLAAQRRIISAKTLPHLRDRTYYLHKLSRWGDLRMRCSTRRMDLVWACFLAFSFAWGRPSENGDFRSRKLNLPWSRFDLYLSFAWADLEKNEDVRGKKWVSYDISLVSLGGDLERNDDDRAGSLSSPWFFTDEKGIRMEESLCPRIGNTVCGLCRVCTSNSGKIWKMQKTIQRGSDSDIENIGTCSEKTHFTFRGLCSFLVDYDLEMMAFNISRRCWNAVILTYFWRCSTLRGAAYKICK